MGRKSEARKRRETTKRKRTATASARRYERAEESDQKKAARFYFWSGQLAMIQVSSPRFLVLASTEAGDVGALLSLGVEQERIVAVDINPEAVEATRAKYPRVDVRLGDVRELAPALGKFDSILLDFCTTATDDAARTFAEVVHLCSNDRSYAAIGIVRGREKDAKPGDRSWIREATEFFKRELGWDEKKALRSGRIIGLDGKLNEATLRQSRLRHRVGLVPIGLIAYQGGVPMAYRDYCVEHGRPGLRRFPLPQPQNTAFLRWQFSTRRSSASRHVAPTIAFRFPHRAPRLPSGALGLDWRKQ